MKGSKDEYFIFKGNFGNEITASKKTITKLAFLKWPEEIK